MKVVYHDEFFGEENSGDSENSNGNTNNEKDDVINKQEKQDRKER